MKDSMKLLIVDDTQENLVTLENIIEEFFPGIEIFKADNARDGLQIASGEEVDGALIDLHMPEMDGLEMCQTMKEDGEIRHIPVYIMTSHHSSPDLSARCLDAGADDFIRRPIDNTELVAKLRVMLRIKRAEEKLHEETRALATLIDRRTRELQGQELRLKAIYEGTDNVAFFIIDMTTTEPIIYDVNPAAAKIFGYAPEELLGRSIELLTDSESNLQFEEIRAPLQQGGKGFDGEVTLLRKSGERLHCLLTVKPLQDISEETIAALVVCIDISARVEALEKLSKLSALNSCIIENSPIGICIYDARGDCVTANDAAADIVGGCMEEVLKQNFHQLDSWKTSGLYDAALVALNERKSKQFSFEVVSSFGKPCNLSTHLVPVKLETEDMLLLMFEDVTDYHQTYDRLIKSETLLAETGQIARVGGWSIDAATGEVSMTDMTYQLLGISRDCSPTLEETLNRFPADDRNRLEAALQRALRHGEPYRFEVRFYNKDDRLRWGMTTCKPTIINNKTVRLVGTFQDITEQKAAEQEKILLVMAIEQSAEAIVITDRDGTIEYVNPAFETMTGYTRREVMGQNPNILKSGVHDDDFYRNMWETLERGETWSGRMTNRKKDGSLFLEESKISPVRDRNGQTTNFIAIKSDITDQAGLEEQLRQSQRMESIGNLAGGVAHDFNNMLSVILGHSEMLQRQVEPGSKVYNELEIIRDAAERSANLTRQLLAFSRKQTLEPRVMNLNALLESLETMLRRLIGENIDIQTEFDETISCIEADPGQIEQIIMNLTVNARDAMPDGGTLTIETSDVFLDENYISSHFAVKSGRYVRLTISDTGCGMDEEVRSHIFEPFFTTKETGQGTGLGLSTVFGIVKQSQGYIWCYSEPGRGSSFKIYLPATPDQVCMDGERSLAPLEKGREEQILVVEDEPYVREVIEAMLDELGYQSVLTHNGAEALAMIERGECRPDLIITDVIMPGIGGKVLIEKVRELRPHQKVIYMSGYTNRTVADLAVDTPGTKFIQKPFPIKEIADAIRALLDVDLPGS